MNRDRPEVADVFRSHGEVFLKTHSTSKEQRRVLKDVVSCRTAALGGHVSKCEVCDHKEVYYNSCRNRHCPKCQAQARAKWLEARAADLLGVGYFHVVFTLPDTLGPIALQNKQVLYGILFRAVSETLLTIARDPKHLGGEIGFMALLHTWGQRIDLHPHLHCVVPGGGLSPDGKRWISSPKDFFLPVRVLSLLFKKKFLAYLKEAYGAGKLSFHGKQEYLKDQARWKRLLSSLYDIEWVVYSKPPFGGPEQVLKYLARYTHRVAISNQRLVSFEDGKVSFRWKDYADGNREKTMTLVAEEFIRRFLLHVIPSGFMRIRHYGFLSNRSRREKIPLCRELIGGSGSTSPSDVQEGGTYAIEPVTEYPICPSCKQGRMMVIEWLDRDPRWHFLFKGSVVYKTN